jgi:hypothetical protein
MTDEELLELAILYAKRMLLAPGPLRQVEPPKPKPIIVAVAGERPPERPLEHCACSPTLH